MQRLMNRVVELLQTPASNGSASGIDDRAASANVCPRCKHTASRPLGPAGSVLNWFACCTCRYVWSSGRPPVVESEPISQLLRTRIVIVDDDVSVLRVLQRALAPYDPATAQSATEALTLIQHCRPELLITDYLMPNITGAELIAHARAQQPGIKVILLTAHGASLEDDAWWTAERRLEKPCGAQAIRDVVQELIGLPRSTAAPDIASPEASIA